MSDFSARAKNTFLISLPSPWPHPRWAMLPAPAPPTRGQCPIHQAQFCRPLVLEAGRERGSPRATRMPLEGRCRSQWPVTQRQLPCCHSYCQQSLLTLFHASRSSWGAQALVRKDGGSLLSHSAILYSKKGCVLQPSRIFITPLGLWAMTHEHSTTVCLQEIIFNYVFCPFDLHFKDILTFLCVFIELLIHI